jgi:lipopolysaccharide/colanic/teichoic acid biosynthesis glycosyltransferase
MTKSTITMSNDFERKEKLDDTEHKNKKRIRKKLFDIFFDIITFVVDSNEPTNRKRLHR